MDFDALVTSLGRQIGVVANAPIPFAACLLIAAYFIWKYNQHNFATRLANAQSTNDFLREKLNRFEASDAIAIASVQIEQEVAAPATQLTSQHRTARVKPKKEYLREGITLEYLMGVYEGRTAIQAKAMLADQIGKWVLVDGSVFQVKELSQGSLLVAMRLADYGLIFCTFEGPNPDVHRLSIGDKVSIDGQLDEISQTQIMLNDCSLV